MALAPAVIVISGAMEFGLGYVGLARVADGRKVRHLDRGQCDIVHIVVLGQ